MAVVLRLSRRGAAKHPFYRIIASPKGSKRDSKFIEIIGSYNPMTNPPTIMLKEDRVRYWVEKGAQPSIIVGKLIKLQLSGFLEGRTDHQRKKIQAARAKRKKAAKKK